MAVTLIHRRTLVGAELAGPKGWWIQLTDQMEVFPICLIMPMIKAPRCFIAIGAEGANMQKLHGLNRMRLRTWLMSGCWPRQMALLNRIWSKLISQIRM